MGLTERGGQAGERRPELRGYVCASLVSTPPRRELPAIAVLLGPMAAAIGPALVELATGSAGRLDAPYTAPKFEYIPLIYPPLYLLLLTPLMPFEPATQYLRAAL